MIFSHSEAAWRLSGMFESPIASHVRTSIDPTDSLCWLSFSLMRYGMPRVTERRKNKMTKFYALRFATLSHTDARMSNFGTFLQNEIDAQSTNASLMAARMGIDRGHLSQFLNDHRRSCNVETLMKMVTGISDDRHVQAGLLEAYFRDQCIDPYKRWISVDPDKETSAPRLRDPSPEGRTDEVSKFMELLRELRLSNTTIRALREIARAVPSRAKFKALIEDLGTFAKEELE